MLNSTDRKSYVMPYPTFDRSQWTEVAISSITRGQFFVLEDPTDGEDPPVEAGDVINIATQDAVCDAHEASIALQRGQKARYVVYCLEVLRRVNQGGTWFYYQLVGRTDGAPLDAEVAALLRDSPAFLRLQLGVDPIGAKGD